MPARMRKCLDFNFILGNNEGISRGAGWIMDYGFPGF